MASRSKWIKVAMVALALVVVAQIAVGVLVRTGQVHGYLIAHLERAFGRQVEVRHFDAQVFPSLRLDASGVTVGEDPAFGNEYFLRADKLTAGLRWAGLLRGHFEFGTLSLTRPSLILVHSGQGRWNLEDWLPPAKNGDPGATRIYGPPSPTGATNHLQKIKFEDGRVDFKLEQDKKPFAFIGVTGTVEQISAGRWQLRLEAQPWRSGVALQSAGILYVRGDIAGTSTRLQPAQLEVHWTEVSLADLLRLISGQDYGVRGSFTLDAVAHSSTPADVRPTIQTVGENVHRPPFAQELTTSPAAGQAMIGSPSDWIFSVQARSSGIHRWDLTERADNPRFTVKLAGRGNIAARTIGATEMSLESPLSNLRGTLHVAASMPELQVDSAGIQAADLLAWWRAFEPGVDEGLTVEQYFTGSAAIRGWPPRIENVAFSSNGGAAKIPGIADPVWIGAVRGGRDLEKLVMDPVRLQLGGERASLISAAKHPSTVPLHNAADLAASQDFAAQEGGLAVEAQVDQIATVLRAASAIGRPVNHGWDLDGRALGSMQWDWYKQRGQRWSGKVVVSKAHLAVAGLNQQLQVGNAACIWDHGRHTVLLGAVDGFGTSWTGAIRENRNAGGDAQPPRWNFSLHGAKLDAAEIDRWVGPRARPGWLRTLLSSLGGASTPASPTGANLGLTEGASASELLRRVDAEGDLNLDTMIVEKLRFENLHVTGRLRGLHLEANDIAAQWAGGKVRGTLNATFAPRPAYDLTAQLDAADLAQLPVLPNVSERWSGFASGNVHLTTEGVGRAEVLQNLAGQGIVSLRNVEFRGWDVGASVADGAAHAGVSRWSGGGGTFSLRNRRLLLDDLRLDQGKQAIFVNGSVDFAREAELLIKSAESEKPASRTPVTGHALKVSGSLDAPLVSIAAASRNSIGVNVP
jgi:AsmA family